MPYEQKVKRHPGGRPRGSRNKATLERLQAQYHAELRARGEIPNRLCCDSLEFLQSIYQDPEVRTETRMEAARIALPFERPKLNAAFKKVEQSVSVKVTDAREKLERLIANRIAREGEAEGSERLN